MILSVSNQQSPKTVKSITTQPGTHYMYLQSFGIIDAKYYSNQPKNADFKAK